MVALFSQATRLGTNVQSASADLLDKEWSVGGTALLHQLKCGRAAKLRNSLSGRREPTLG